MSSIYANRWYQDEAEFSIFDYFQRGGVGNPVVAMPTGTGKSVVIANFIRRIFGYWPNQRVMMLFSGFEFARNDYANRFRRRSIGRACN